MATANGAKATGFEDTGKLAAGNKADIILINADQPHICPIHDIKSAVVYSVQAGDVDTVIINGKTVMQGRQLACMDEELIKAKVREIARRIC
jgi:5-methylthioadenosine/S-adenosylhomocysteine deaminase